MTLIRASALVTVSWLLAVTASAQTNDTTAPAQDAEQPTTQTEGDATPQDAPPEQPEEKVFAVHADWQVRCRVEPDCFMYQLIKDARDVPIAEVNVIALDREDGAVAGVTVVTPLRTLLTEGLTLQIDNGRLQKYPYLFCAPAGCAARFGYDANGLAQLKRGNLGRVTITSVDRPDAPVTLDMSLSGFTAAFDELAKLVKQ